MAGAVAGQSRRTQSTPGEASRLRIVVLGYVVRCPLGGMVWHHLQYVLGLSRLGHDVYFVEDSDDYTSCYDPSRDVMDVDPTYGLQFTHEVFRTFDLDDRWAYHDAHTERWLGPCSERILDVCRAADVVLNISGVNPLRPWLRGVPTRVQIDTDPAFTQIRHLTDPQAQDFARAHTAFFTFGENIGRQGCHIPDDGVPWRPTRQPVVLDCWPVTPGRRQGKFTTVMQWDSYAAREYDGRRYGMKSESFGPYFSLPQKAGPVFDLAVGSASAPREELCARGWQLSDPLEVTRSPWTYQRFIQESKAEFSVAKHGYVAARTGWFSERSACYLSTGRPVLLQDTGYSDCLPTGEGLIAFNTPEEALAGAEDIDARYERHCDSARAIAEQHFDARKVLPRLIEDAIP